MKIKNLYFKTVLESFTNFYEDSLNHPLHNLTLISIDKDLLVFNFLNRNIQSTINLENSSLDLSEIDSNETLINTLRLSKLLREIKTDTIINYKKKNSGVELNTNNGIYKLSLSTEVNEFKKRIFDYNLNNFLGSMKIKDFNKLIHSISKVCVDSSQNLTSLMKFIFEKNKLTIYATDAYRAARVISYLEHNSENGEINVEKNNEEKDILWKTEINVLGKLIKKYVLFLESIIKVTNDDTIRIFRDENKLILKTKNSITSIVISSKRLYDLSFHFEIKDSTKFTINAKELRDSINRLNVFVRNSTELFLMAYKKKEIILSSIDNRLSNSGEEILEISDFHGEEGEIKFTASLLKNSLDKYPTTVTFSIKSPKKPFLLNTKEEETSLTFVVLPIT